MSKRGLAAVLSCLLCVLPACGGAADNADTAPTVTIPSRPPSTPAPPHPPPLPAAATIFLFGAEAGDSATSAVVGDFNGDGSTDVAMGAALADGPANERPDAGEVHLFLGPLQPGTIRDAGAGQQDLTIYGADAGDHAGRALAAGDINGDGSDDLVIGSGFGDGPAGDRTDAGEVAVLFGGAGLVPESRMHDLRDGASLRIYGADVEDLLGFALGTGDVNGDGVTDIVAGALWGDGPGNNREQSGEVYVVFGSSSLSGTLDLAARPADAVFYGAEAADQLGEELAVGDLNNDGLADLVLAAPFAPSLTGQEDAGRTYVILSPPRAITDLASDEANAMIVGTDGGDQLGHSLAIGDNDGDGVGDLLLGAVSADGFTNETELAGEVCLVLGSTLAGVIDTAMGGATATLYGIDEEDRLGRSVAFLDLDDDGDDEAVMSAPGAAGPGNASPNAGEVYVMQNAQLSGRIQLPDLAVSYAGAAGNMTGSSVTGKPALSSRDVNGDGRAELIVGAGGSDGPDGSRTDAGAVFIFFMV